MIVRSEKSRRMICISLHEYVDVMLISETNAWMERRKPELIDDKKRKRSSIGNVIKKKQRVGNVIASLFV